jgi:glycerophosphoryl diester phosphodiesterase
VTSILEKLSVKPFSIIGHRGAAGRFPENTLRSINYAISVGVEVVEVDVRATRDGFLVVFHDADFKRLAGIDVSVRSVEYSWIRSNVLINGEHVPLLEEVLDAVRDRVGLFIEIKEPDTTKRVVELIRSRGVIDQVAIISFYDEALITAKRVEPRIVTGLIYAQPPGRVLDAVRLGARVVLPHYRITSEKSISYAHRYGLKVVAWTVNSRVDAVRLVESGVDGLATDIPDELVKLRSELRASARSTSY